MSADSTEEKTARHHSQGGPAKASLVFLRKMGGFRVLEGSEKEPRLISVCPMEETRTWRLIEGSGGMYAQEARS